MTFIPHKNIKIGDKVYISKDIKVLSGVFTKGHEFTVIGESARGLDLEDSDGHRLLETLFELEAIHLVV